jgi:hypothetical protein
VVWTDLLQSQFYLLYSDRFSQKVTRSQSHCIYGDIYGTVGSKNNHFQGWSTGSSRTKDSHSIYGFHFQVGEDNIGRWTGLQKSNRSLTIVGCFDLIPFFRQNTGEGICRGTVIVNN